MTELDDSVRAGHYARKQLLSKDRLIAWSHSRRYATGLRLAERFARKRVLDYGCGDGTFLALLMSGPYAASHAVGVEIDESLVDDCRRRLGERAGLSFISSRELQNSQHLGFYDAVICMEVLEHAIDPQALLRLFFSLLAPGAVLLISVPVETGLPVIVKQTVRRIAGWRGIGDYPGTTAYRWSELLRSLFAGETQHIERPVIQSEDGRQWHDHKGFNWMRLRTLIKEDFVLERVLSSPLAGLSPHLASQAWFLAHKRS